MKYLLSILLLIIAALTVVAEDNNRCFKAYDLKGKEVEVICVGQRVRFKDCTGKVDADKEYYDFDDRNGVNFTNDTTKFYTFTEPGRYTVTQFANLNGENGTISRVFEVKDSPAPSFSVARCANRQIRVTITDKTYDSYTLKFGNSAAKAVQSGQRITYTYNTTEPPNITLNGSYTKSTCSNSNTIEVNEFLPALPKPVFQELALNKEAATNGSISIKAEQLVAGFIYVLEQSQNGSSNFAVVDTLRNITANTATYTFNNLNTSQSTCFRIRATDACGSIQSESNILCTINPKTTVGEKAITLNWPFNPVPVTGFEVYRQNQLIANLPASANSFTDKNLSCGQEYCYTLKATAPGGYTSTSAPICATATSTEQPPAPYLLASFDLNNQVVLTLQTPQDQLIKQIELQRSTGGASYQAIPNVQQFPFTDQTLATPTPVCYRATYTNACGLASTVSNTTCPVILTARQANDGSVIFSWTSFSGFKDGTGSYTLELLDESSVVKSTYSVTGNTFTDRSLSNSEQVLRYRIKASSKSGAETTYSNIQTIKQEIQLHIPSGFTPNNDGLNDVLEIKGRFYQEFSIRVYNRMGQVVYTSENATAGWDGTYNGQKLPAGAYTYEINVKDEDGTPKRRTGTVTLIR